MNLTTLKVSASEWAQTIIKITSLGALLSLFCDEYVNMWVSCLEFSFHYTATGSSPNFAFNIKQIK